MMIMCLPYSGTKDLGLVTSSNSNIDIQYSIFNFPVQLIAMLCNK